MSLKSETPHEEIQRLLKAIAGKASPDENVDSLISRASRRVGISYSKARAYWYGEAAVVHSLHMDAARRAEGSSTVDDALVAVEAMLRVGGEMLNRLPCASIRAMIFAPSRSPRGCMAI